ncbi:DUF6153 family protein [Actinokineospora globicatena]|uniref:DUF6153 family protein n=1 Tax=Actinokineospora globicatena TaxID=103729 RepID=UPI0024A28C7B|nr:hypothetical protein Aglo01_64060 [Actinokineospora globicatena]GLW88719.1 hypothetical protein Aglo02_63580 [Actinokineospora globicatena]
MGRSIARWVLLSALLLGVVGMHHLTGEPGPTDHPVSHAAHMPPAEQDTTGDAPHEPMSSHDLLHLCLAVLAAAAGLGLVWLLLSVVVVTKPVGHSRPLAIVTAPRAPPVDLLLSLCVSRR